MYNVLCVQILKDLATKLATVCLSGAGRTAKCSGRHPGLPQSALTFTLCHVYLRPDNMKRLTCAAESCRPL